MNLSQVPVATKGRIFVVLTYSSPLCWNWSQPFVAEAFWFWPHPYSIHPQQYTIIKKSLSFLPRGRNSSKFRIRKGRLDRLLTYDLFLSIWKEKKTFPKITVDQQICIVGWIEFHRSSTYARTIRRLMNSQRI